MNTNKKNLLIQVLALLGLGLAIKLAFIYYSANFDEYSLSSFCSINDFIDCDGAARTNAAQFLGIPLAYWGIFFYLTVLFLTFVDKLKNIKLLRFLEVFKAPMVYITLLGTISFVVSMTLAGISLFKIQKLCILCLATYFIDFVIALVASDCSLIKIAFSFKTTFLDFIAGAKKYVKTTILLVLLATSFLAYSGITLNFVPHVKQRREIMKYRKIKFNPYRISGNILGSEKADVVINLYSDFVCPLCYINNIMVHKAAKEFSNVKIIHHNLPFDKECNPFINFNMHPNACFMTRGALAAKKQGNYWEMSSLLYENQPKKMDDMLILVDKINLDKNQFIKDFESNTITVELAKEIEAAEKLEISATPTMYINKEQIVGVKPYYELREILIKHGAKRK